MQLVALAMLCLCQGILAQNDYTQNLRGVVLDKDAKTPLIGATISVTTLEPIKGASTDLEGNFRLENIPIGRHNIQVQYVGYEPVFLNSLLLKTGKELVLTIELVESATNLEEIVVSSKSQLNKAKPLNEMAVVSARSFSVEETSRYASALFDPSRMAQNYAGVTIGAGEDLFNEIVIRGNSPSGVMWRLEGIQIPNPNHFGGMGNSGGAISMLSSSTLSNSDFYTGAFPSEFGNALSGVFDLKMRNGNNEKREYAFMFGALGIELAAEGPLNKKSKASYLINYRYSTLAAMVQLGISPTGDVLPAYQDLSFNVNVPTDNAGVFKLFGLGGTNTASFSPEADSLKWESSDDKYGFSETQDMGTIGLSHRLLLPKNAYLKTVAVASYERTKEDEYFLNKDEGYKKQVEYADQPSITTYRLNSTYTRKLNAKNTIQFGGVLSYQNFDVFIDELDEEQNGLVRLFENDGNSSLIQGFGHWKHRFNDKLTLNSGLHYTQMTLNNKFSIEPRAAISWKVDNKQTLSAAVGLYSKQEHLAIYLFDGMTPSGRKIESKKYLGLTKSLHAVLGYDFIFNSKLRLKTELYYQYLYDVPVSTDITSTYSILNAFDIWEVIGLESATNKGTGQNMGLDLTMERFFSNDYYFMVTGSLYDSKYTAADGKTYNTRFNGNFQLNTLGGKEWKVGKRKKNIFGINGKFVISGGVRYTPVDLPASILAEDEILDYSKNYQSKTPTYYRFDLGLSYKINRKRLTHTILLDIQNVTNRENLAYLEFNDEDLELEQLTQSGLFPTFNYRIEF